MIYLLQSGFTTGGFDVPAALAQKTNFLGTTEYIVNWILGFVGTVALLVIIWAGFTYVTSAGNADKLKKAKSAITFAIIGIIIVAISYSAVVFLTHSLAPGVIDVAAGVPTVVQTNPGAPRSGVPTTTTAVPVTRYTVVGTPAR